MCSLVTRNNWPRVIWNHRKLTCVKFFCSSKSVSLARLLLRAHFHILGSYFLPPLDSRTTSVSLIYRYEISLSSYTTSKTCPVMSSQGIPRQTDDKSGYQHLKIEPDSQEFFSFSWRGYYFSFCILPFGWRASFYLYHNVGPVVTSTARSLGLPVSQYIDDRHVGQLFLSSPAVCQPSRQLAQAAAFILVFLLISAGYFVNLAKSSPQPSTFVKFLCFISDSVLQAFLVQLDN